MAKHERIARIEGIDLDTGVFTMTLATEGEASDGHILSIKGGQIPERMPLLTSHWNDPTSALGSITDPQKLLKDSPPRLKAIGHIEMGGEGATADIRRDLAHMIDKGHVNGMSIRWDEIPGKTVRRTNLPSDHPHYVSQETANGPERFGLFFEEWIAREGSVVAVGADPAALIGRADETEGEVASFWRAMAEDLERENQRPDPANYEDEAAFMEACVPMLVDEGNDQDQAVAICASMWADRAESEDESPSAKIAASLAGLRIDAAACREAGASHADCINAVVDNSDCEIESVEIGEFVVFLAEPVASIVRESVTHVDHPSLSISTASSTDSIFPDPIADLVERLEALESRVESALDERAVTGVSPASPIEEREEADPLPAVKSLKSLSEELRELFAESDARQSKFVQRIYDEARGKVKHHG